MAAREAGARHQLPTGTVTFLLTDIEGSTRIWELHPAAMQAPLARHDTFLASAIGDHGGVLIKSKGEGDSAFAVVSRASDALTAALRAQQSLAAEVWPDGIAVAVRMALHTGEAELRGGNHYGAAINAPPVCRSWPTGVRFCAHKPPRS